MRFMKRKENWRRGHWVGDPGRPSQGGWWQKQEGAGLAEGRPCGAGQASGW